MICGLIGDPVAHSLSPVMHNTAFQSLSLNYAYIPFKVNSEALGKAINGMRALHIRGLNVTIPHKVAVIPLLDKLDHQAMMIGAVNTVVNDNGILTGYNTDAGGFLQSLTENNIEITGKKVLILGAGGAARSISFALMEKNVQISLLNRSIEKANVVADLLNTRFGKKVEVSELNEDNLQRDLHNCDLVVNTTSAGMHPNSNETPIPAHLLKKTLIIYDIIYSPIITRLMRDAGMQGARVVGGVDMLVWQGAQAFEKWTGRSAPVKIMKKVIMKQLKYHEE